MAVHDMELDPAIVAKLREQAERARALSEELASPEVAGGSRYAALLREHGRLEVAARLFARVEALTEREREARTILEESAAEPDLQELARAELEEIEAEAQQLLRDAQELLVRDEDEDRTKVILEIRAGTGGDEATLFAADLARIYRRFAELRRWKVEELGATPTDVGGYKEIRLGVSGPDCWRLLRFESGVHRVQRVPATEAQGRIHTSAATVAVLPEAEEAEVEIREEDLRIDTMRSSGPGGQHVNKTSSAVRITHLPTGTVVVCQDEKSQHKNRAKAMRVLASRLLDAERRRLQAERAESRKSQIGTGDRSQRIRTYNWPQSRVTDHRLKQNFPLEQVLAGKLDPLVEALGRKDLEERIAAL